MRWESHWCGEKEEAALLSKQLLSGCLRVKKCPIWNIHSILFQSISQSSILNTCCCFSQITRMANSNHMTFFSSFITFAMSHNQTWCHKFNLSLGNTTSLTPYQTLPDHCVPLLGDWSDGTGSRGGGPKRKEPRQQGNSLWVCRTPGHKCGFASELGSAGTSTWCPLPASADAVNVCLTSWAEKASARWSGSNGNFTPSHC